MEKSKQEQIDSRFCKYCSNRKCKFCEIKNRFVKKKETCEKFNHKN
jgi:hypothetical protein